MTTTQQRTRQSAPAQLSQHGAGNMSRWLIAVLGTAMLPIVGWEGSPGWQAARVALVVGVTTGAEPPLSLRDAVVAIAPRPILLITAGNRAVEATAADYFAAAAPATVSIWEVEGAGHTAGLTTAPAEWEQRVVEFLDETLAR